MLFRSRRLEDRLRELTHIQETASPAEKEQSDARFDAKLPSLSIHDYEDMDLETTDSERFQFETQVEYVVDRATAAQTIPELRVEIAILEDLIRVAYKVRRLDDDKKWVQLRTILASSGACTQLRWKGCALARPFLTACGMMSLPKS